MPNVEFKMGADTWKGTVTKVTTASPPAVPTPNFEIKIGADTWKGTVTKVTTTPPAVPTATLKCEPATVTAGKPVTLTWTAANGQAKLDGVAVAAGTDRTKQDTPTTSKTYRLEVTGAAGTTPAVATASVTVTPVTPPPPPPPPPAGRRLLGGVRLRGAAWATAPIAIDWDRKKLFLGGGGNDVLEYDMPATIGQGADPAAWPEISPHSYHAGWWPKDDWGPPAQHGWPYCNGLSWHDGTLWATTRRFYDYNPPPTLTLYGMDGRKKIINLPRQHYGGFVKRGPNQEPFLGCGGYESGQGSCPGPTLAKMDGTPLIPAWDWHELPGSNLEYWNTRCPRPDNYWPVGHVDAWPAWEPRVRSGGVREGRWAVDRVWGGGLMLPEGVCYWALVGTGVVDYGIQTDVFVPWDMERVYKYTFDATTFKFKSYEEWPAPLLVKPRGQELDAQGRVYLSMAHAWDGGGGYADPAIFVYG